MTKQKLRTAIGHFHAHMIKRLTLREAQRDRAYPTMLRNYEKSITSQTGEDGIIGEIFGRIGATNRYFVEFGIQTGEVCCCRHLLEHGGWSGLWMEGSAEDAARAKELFASRQVSIRPAFITAENILDHFKVESVPSAFDLLVIDIDGNDYHIWKQVATEYKPRVVVIEYNAAFGHSRKWVMPYDPYHKWDYTSWFGASLAALSDLGRQLGYRLVGCDRLGVNAYFVQEIACVDARFPYPLTANFQYSCPKYGKRGWYGHPLSKNLVGWSLG
jgi:hypothetical protein